MKKTNASINSIQKLLVAGLLSSVAFSGIRAQTVIASDDVTVRHTQDNQNENGNLEVKRDSDSTSSGNRAGYLKFDFGGEIFPSTSPAQFSVRFDDESGTLNSSVNLEAWGLDAGYTGAGVTDWEEASLQNLNDALATYSPGYEDSRTWDSSPADFTQIGSTVSFNPSTTVSGTVFNFNISDLSDFIQSDDTLTIALVSKTNTGNVLGFFSSEDIGNEPTISIIPEPSSVMLVLTAFFGLFLMHKKRK